MTRRTELGKRASALAEAKPSEAVARQLVGVLAVLGLACTLATGVMALAIPSAFLLGLVVSRDPERFYLEGFSDGLAAGDVISAAIEPDGRALARRDMGELPAEPRDDRGAAGRDEDPQRHAGRRQREDRGPEPIGDLADAFGVRIDPGPARPPLDGQGRPVPGPTRPSHAADLGSGARVMGAPVVLPTPRPAAGSEDHHRLGPS